MIFLWLYYIQEVYLKFKNTREIKVKWWRKDIPGNIIKTKLMSLYQYKTNRL